MPCLSSRPSSASESDGRGAWLARILVIGPIFDLLSEVTGAYFHGRAYVSFRLYLSPFLELCNRSFNGSLGFMTVDEIKKHLLGLSQ